MTALPLCDATHSQLVVIDIQERFVAAMPSKPRQQTLRNAKLLAQAAKTLQIPITHTEQYPKGLGMTEKTVRSHLSDSAAIEKTCFSCFAADGFSSALALHQRQQIVLCGMESHVCVLQTAIELQQAGYQVFVVEDAVCSRHKQNHKNALARLRQSGITISNVESVIFEWLRDASHPNFKTLSRLLR
ncbi:MAG: hydrolase [Halobacteria archaeon]|nr:hydrolase [Halobacteria archaeon]